uniref:Nucleoside phosphorylase domain-containing protein n=1 Tax=Strongyloides stercoralis TaxID=6248 RepID=A0A0K0DSH3_STRER
MSTERHSLIVLKPIIRSPTHNVIRIERKQDLNTDEILHIAGGDHAGVIVNKFTGTYEPLEECDLLINFSVWLTIPGEKGDERRQEIRIIKFIFDNGIEKELQHECAEQIFKDIISLFPRDYLTFIKRMLKIMEDGYEEIKVIEIDMKLADEDEVIEMPNDYDSEPSDVEVTSGHVQELLEHAFPNSLKVSNMANVLKCSEEEIQSFLMELAEKFIVERVDNEDNEWIRIEGRHIDQNIAFKKHGESYEGKEQPTIAIITSLYSEKKAIDAIIENSHTFHKYRASGESNVYTTGNIGPHRVVATKLPGVGDSNFNAYISASGGTTRLLGNYQNVNHVIILGAAGGALNFSNVFNSNVNSVKLGDVVVSNSRTFSDTASPSYIYVNKYTTDRNTDEYNGYMCSAWRPEDNILAQIASQTNDASLMSDWEAFTQEIIDTLNKSAGDKSFSKPNEADILKVPVGGGNFVVVPHQNPESLLSKIHVGPIGGMKPLIEIETDNNKSFGNESFNTDYTKTVYYNLKEKFVKDHQLKAIDAGSESVISAIQGSCIGSWSLIRGITDYQNGLSRSGRVWQPYAAARAAALVKAILERLPSSP